MCLASVLLFAGNEGARHMLLCEAFIIYDA
jgi:hypothetical protein